MSLLEILIVEGRDIWKQVDRDFFSWVKNRHSEPIVPHTVMKSHYTIGTVRRYDWRYSHEIAHLVCCRDENVNNPAYDFDHFVDSDGQFTREQTLLEVEVLFVDGLLLREFHEEENRFSIEELIAGNCHSFFPLFSAPICMGIERNELECFVKEKIVQKWNLSTILDEALRKYELVRLTR